MNELKDMFEKIVREEVATTLQRPLPHRWTEAITDPSSGEFSMSRICFGILVAGIVAMDAMAVYLGLKGQLPEAWVPHLTTMNTAALVSVAGVYGFNSLAGAAVGAKERIQAWMGKTNEFPGE
jgi:hypothetical protein